MGERKRMKKKLETLIANKKKEMDLLYFDKYSPLFHDAYGFLANKKAIMYGGTALNELMPTPLKFYEPYTLPDIDVLSPYAEKLARKMVRFYRKKNREAVSFTEALHPGTYKVYADGIQIADITQCGHRTYEILRQQCVRSQKWKIKIAPPIYLRMTLHKIFSQPMDAHRWENVQERLERYYKTFPITCSLKKKKIPSPSKTKEKLKMIHKIYETMPPETVFFGDDELELLLGKPFPLVAPIQMLTNQNFQEIKYMIKEILPELKISPIFHTDELILPHIILSYKDQPIAIIYQLSSCVAFHQYKNKRIASIHTMMDMFLSMSLSHYSHFKKQKTILQCLSDELGRLQQQQSRKKLLEQFTTDCYGPSIGIATMRRERVKRLYKKKMPVFD